MVLEPSIYIQQKLCTPYAEVAEVTHELWSRILFESVTKAKLKDFIVVIKNDNVADPFLGCRPHRTSLLRFRIMDRFSYFRIELRGLPELASL